MEFKTDDRVTKLVTSIMKKHHKHLSPEKVVTILKSKAVGKKMAEQDAGQRTRISKVQKLADKIQFLTGYYFVIEIDESIWSFLKDEHKNAIVDEALCQMGMNDKGPHLIDPDVEIYTAVIERHGFYTEELQAVRARISQLNLFPPEGESAESVQ